MTFAEIPFFALPPTAERAANMIAIKYKSGGWVVLPTDSSEKPDFYAVASGRTSPDCIVLKNSRGEPLGFVWKNPNSSLILDFEIVPLPHSPTAKME